MPTLSHLLPPPIVCSGSGQVHSIALGAAHVWTSKKEEKKKRGEKE